MENDLKLAVRAYYTNWKGETELRTFQPTKIWFGHTQYHPEDQWLLEAIDLDKKEVRNFAMKDLTNWDKVPKFNVDGSLGPWALERPKDELFRVKFL